MYCFDFLFVGYVYVVTMLYLLIYTMFIVSVLRRNDVEMDINTMYHSGQLFFSGGLISLGFTVHSCVYYTLFSLTEVIISSLVVIWGICLMMIGRRMKKSIPKAEEEDQSGRISPFYYELEPVNYKRDLPPIPRDICREYDPIIRDKV